MKFLAKQKIKGEITAPNSKSHFIRLVAGALLCNLESEISYFVANRVLFFACFP